MTQATRVPSLSISELSSAVEIRTFVSWEDIEKLPGFKADNPLTKSNYKKLIGDYDFTDEVRCCFQKDNGKLCHEEHKRGFVALLTDDSVTIIGNDCARDKFEADSAIRHDRARYDNEKRRRARWESLLQILDQEPVILAELDELVRGTAEIRSRVTAFREVLGPETLGSLDHMCKTGNASVSVRGVVKREYLDEEGEVRYERSKFPIALGAVSGIAIMDMTAFSRVPRVAKEIHAAFKAARELRQDAKAAAIESLVAVLNDHTQVRHWSERIAAEEKRFFDGDLSLLCFLAAERAERYATVRNVLNRQGANVGKDAAKEWLANREREVARTAKADYIEVI